jgi:hypothetical protein
LLPNLFYHLTSARDNPITQGKIRINGKAKW